MDNRGWIKVYRKIEDCPIWFDEKFDRGHAWIDLLLMANHRPKTIFFENNPMVIGTGQILTSVRKLSARWGWNKDTTLKFLRLLEDQKMILRDSNSRRTLLTIVNYELYQGHEDTEQDTQSDTSSDTPSDAYPPQTRIKELKNNTNVAPKEQRESDKADFEVIYSKYPKKKSGRGRALKIYLGWTSSKGRYVNGHYVKLTREQIWKGVQTYCKQQHAAGTDLQYWKNFDTLMNQILDYIGGEDG